jgi:hypothetical protein
MFKRARRVDAPSFLSCIFVVSVYYASVRRGSRTPSPIFVLQQCLSRARQQRTASPACLGRHVDRPVAIGRAWVTLASMARPYIRIHRRRLALRLPPSLLAPRLHPPSVHERTFF